MIFLILHGQSSVLASNEGQLRIYNNVDCAVAMSGSLVGNFSIEPLDVLHINYNPAVFNETDVLSIDVNPMCQFLKTGNLKQRVSIVKEMVRAIMVFLILSTYLTKSYFYICFIKGFVVFINI